MSFNKNKKIIAAGGNLIGAAIIGAGMIGFSTNITKWEKDGDMYYFKTVSGGLSHPEWLRAALITSTVSSVMNVILVFTNPNSECAFSKIALFCNPLNISVTIAIDRKNVG